MAKVYKVEVDVNGIRDLFKSQEVQDELLRICSERADEIDRDARQYLHAPLRSPLFVAKVQTEDNTCIGIIHGIGIRTRTGQVRPIAQQIDNKHHVMKW